MVIINPNQLKKGSQVSSVQLSQWIFLHKARAADLLCLSPGTISLCTPRAGQCSAVPTALESFGFWQQNYMSSANLTANQRTVWGEFARGVGDEGLSFMEKPHGSNHWWCGTLNTHLKRPTKVELNTDLGFPWSNPADRALFKRDHSKKTLKVLTEGLKCAFLW